MKTTDLHQEALTRARAGDTQAALDHFAAYLERHPDNGHAWNDAGSVLYAQGRIDEAVRYFRRAAELTHRPPKAFGNLAMAYVATGQPHRAVQWTETLHREGLLDATLIRQCAQAFCAQNDLASAMDVLCRGRDNLPDAADLDRQIETLRDKRAKIAFFVGGDGDTFLKDIIAYTRRRYPVRLFDGKTTADVHELMRWSDISWFEWATNLAAEASKMPKVCRTIVRLHRYEAYECYPSQIRWDAVDTLITVGNSYVVKAMNSRVGDIAAKTSVVRIPNGVDLEAIPFTPRQAGKNLAFVGNLRMVKNPMLLLYCMAALKAVDPEYRLFIAGRMEDPLLGQYVEHTIRTLGLKEHIIDDGFQSDIPGWLADKHIIVSTSVIESQGMGILEAMACGLKPAIHHFPGADETFGTQWLFSTPDDFCRQICRTDYDSESYRAFVERRYALSQQLLHINELLVTFEKNPWTPQLSVGAKRLSRLSALAV